jgi:hypothetical protein
MYITNLSQELGQPLPPICISLPPTITSSNIKQTIDLIPNNVTPYINALQWMNNKLSKAHSNLGSALQGNAIEGFDSCANISQCISDNPILAQQIAEQISKQDSQNIEQLEEQLINVINPFLSSSELNSILQVNSSLVEKSQKIQDQAQSGELVNQINVPGGNTRASYTMPEGASTLKDMQQTNPDQYNKLKSNYKQWFSIKQLMEQINSNL